MKSWLDWAQDLATASGWSTIVATDEQLLQLLAEQRELAMVIADAADGKNIEALVKRTAFNELAAKLQSLADEVARHREFAIEQANESVEKV